MTDVLEIDGKLFHPIKEAAQAVSYSRDYITRLARDKKIIASYIGRQWFIDLDSLRQYIESATFEQEIRKRQLSEERIREREFREVVERQHTLRLKKAQSLNLRAVTAASLVLGFGLLSGLAAHQLFFSVNYSDLQVANTQVAQAVLPSENVQSVSSVFSSTLDDKEEPPVVVPPSTQELRPIENAQNGILLLSNNSSTTNIEEMLSDKVVVEVSPEGTQFVVRVDESGNVVGNSIPFVVVPVEREKI